MFSHWCWMWLYRKKLMSPFPSRNRLCLSWISAWQHFLEHLRPLIALKDILWTFLDLWTRYEPQDFLSFTIPQIPSLKWHIRPTLLVRHSHQVIALWSWCLQAGSQGNVLGSVCEKQMFSALKGLRWKNIWKKGKMTSKQSWPWQVIKKLCKSDAIKLFYN